MARKNLTAIKIEGCRTASCTALAMHFRPVFCTGNLRRRSRARAFSCLLSEVLPWSQRRLQYWDHQYCSIGDRPLQYFGDIGEDHGLSHSPSNFPISGSTARRGLPGLPGTAEQHGARPRQISRPRSNGVSLRIPRQPGQPACVGLNEMKPNTPGV